MGRTIAEKIFSRKAGREVSAGELVFAEPDFSFSHDGNRPLIMEVIEELGGKYPLHPERYALVIDHSFPPPNQQAAEVHRRMRDYAAECGAHLYAGEGICHVVLPEKGHVRPGALVIATDSHTCTYGGINVFSAGVGASDLAASLISGTLWFKVPRSVRIEVRGRWPRGVYAKDLLLHVAGKVSTSGLDYMSAEWTGEAIAALSVEERFTIANMGVELGAKAALFEADGKTHEWVRARTDAPYEAVSADPDAEYADRWEFDVSGLVPLVAVPDRVDAVEEVAGLAGRKVSYAFLGTCTNSRVRDWEEAARILRGKKVAPGVVFNVFPGSMDVYREVTRRGLAQVFLEAGAHIHSPGCGPCSGATNGIPADGEVVISAANRNFTGRMGNPKARIYLASPATVAASAVAGEIADPRALLDSP